MTVFGPDMGATRRVILAIAASVTISTIAVNWMFGSVFGITVNPLNIAPAWFTWTCLIVAGVVFLVDP